MEDHTPDITDTEVVLTTSAEEFVERAGLEDELARLIFDTFPGATMVEKVEVDEKDTTHTSRQFEI